MPTDWKEDKLKYKYDPLPEEPKYIKKKKKKKAIKSDHKHESASCIFIVESFYYDNKKKYTVRGTYCPICGKVEDVYYFQRLDPAEFPSLPVFKLKSYFQKYIDIK